MVPWDNLMALATELSSFCIRTTSAASMAISVPAPMAIPISALVRAGASFIPSPTIITLPDFMSSLIFSSFPSGRTPAITSSTPTCLPMAFAVFSLSPVSMITLKFISLSSLMVSTLSSLTTSATAIIPRSCHFPVSSVLAKNNGVFPSSANKSDCLSASSDIMPLWFT